MSPPSRRSATGLETQLWRGVVAFRLAALGYVAVLVLPAYRDYAHPAGGLAVLAAMVGWTPLMTAANSRDAGRRWLVVGADLLVCVGLTLASVAVLRPEQAHGDTPVLTAMWSTSPLLSAAVLGGPVGGLVSAAVLAATLAVVRRRFQLTEFGALVTLAVAGAVTGYVVRLAVRAERRASAAVRLEAATRERERLARAVHDGVLQVLALVRRRGEELGGEAGELARLAGEQEVALRGLVSAPGWDGRGDPLAGVGGAAGAGAAAAGSGSAAAGGLLDLRGLVGAERSSHVTVSAPAEPVPLPAPVAREVAATVRAALDNVVRHAGPDARAWVLVDDLGDAVAVSVRDDGPGIPVGRLERAAAEGRLGVAASMRGRVAELGGTLTVTCTPGEGTEVEFRLPRPGGDRTAEPPGRWRRLPVPGRGGAR